MLKGIVMNIDEIMIQAKNYLKQQNIPECEILEILQKVYSNGSIGYQMTLSEKTNTDVGYIMKMNIEGFKDGYLEVREEDYNIDSCLFSDLENGYEIIYMPLVYHYGIWCCVKEQSCDDFMHQEGLQMYLKYCKEHHISQEILLQLGRYAYDVPNIMKLYQEKNIQYSIIDEFVIGEKSIVLAYQSSSNEYVTWRTTPTRKRGFDIGHYFDYFGQAYRDFMKRSHNTLDEYFIEHKIEIQPKTKEKNNYER